MDQNQEIKNQIIERLRSANNVLVTVSNNPSVDQLSSAIGLTLLLNKLGKHATAVFSGQVPSTIEFLKPEQTLEKTTDSLRDFIIALDKSKADKLRYKVEDKVVKIFITPYRTTITDKDLQFSQGDFNVDAVMALGVHKKEELDQAITSHGRILHDAAVIAVNNSPNGELGNINWIDTNASSLCEQVVNLTEAMSGSAVDAQMANAFLTGIVSETQRFSNAKATPAAIAMASRLVAAGANPQLIAKELEQKPPEPPPATAIPLNKPDKPSPLSPKKPEPPKDDKTDGTISINHGQNTLPLGPPPAPDEDQDYLAKIDIDTEGTLRQEEEMKELAAKKAAEPSPTLPKLVTEAPALGGTLSANTKPESYSPSTDPFSQPSVNSSLLSHGTGVSAMPKPQTEYLDTARDAVSQAINAAPDTQPPKPVAALNAQPIDLGPPPSNLPPNLIPPAPETPVNNSPPPPVPPPLMPPVL